GGIPVGALAGGIFGYSYTHVVGMIPLVTGSVLGTIFVTMGALFFDFGGQWRNVARSFLSSVLSTPCTGPIGILVLQLLNIEAWFFLGTTSTLMTRGGAILGVVIGMVLGLQVGLTLVLYRLWQVTE